VTASQHLDDKSLFFYNLQKLIYNVCQNKGAIPRTKQQEKEMVKHLITIMIVCLFAATALGGCRWAGRTVGRIEKGTQRTVHHIEKGAQSTADKIERRFDHIEKNFQKGYEEGKQ
jgi:hypothetical protein